MTDSTLQEAKSDNELIAEFMGLPLTKQKVKFTGGMKTVPFQRWKYHESWDWLMPVVEKIESLTPPVKMPDDLEALRDGTHPIDHWMNVTALPLSSNIEDAYKGVVEFIKWHRDNG